MWIPNVRSDFDGTDVRLNGCNSTCDIEGHLTKTVCNIKVKSKFLNKCLLFSSSFVGGSKTAVIKRTEDYQAFAQVWKDHHFHLLLTKNYQLPMQCWTSWTTLPTIYAWKNNRVDISRFEKSTWPCLIWYCITYWTITRYRENQSINYCEVN